MASHRTFVVLMLMIGFVFAFNANDYLYPTEPSSVVSYSNFTLDGTQYSIVSINNVDTFLVTGSDIVTDNASIKAILDSYYAANFLPSPQDIGDLTSLVQQYNLSRNNGQKFKNQEENACRGALFIDGRVKWNTRAVTCRNESEDDLCKIASNLMYQYLSSGTGAPPVGSPSDLYPSIKEFGFASYGTDLILSNDLALLAAAQNDTSQIGDALAYIRNTTPALVTYKNQMENNLYTLNANKTVDSKHWGLCPDIDLNDTVLDQIGSSVSALGDKIAPYSGRLGSESTILQNTLTRLDYQKNINKAKYFNDLYSSINVSGSAAIALGKEALIHVADENLSAKLEKLTALQTTIPEDIAAKEFTNLDSDILSYKNLTQEVNMDSASLIAAYDKARIAKNSANSILLILETRDSDPVTMKSLDLLKNETEDLNARFRDGLSVAELEGLSSNFTSVETRASALLGNERQMPATRVLSMFRGFARKVNTGLAKTALETSLINPKDIPKGMLPLGAFCALVFLSFSSISLVIFLYVFSTFRFHVPKAGHIFAVAFICALMALMVFSGFMYIFLGKTSTDANLQEFMSDFNSTNSTSIFVDMTNTTSVTDEKAMQYCAGVLANSLSGMNKTWTMYTMSQTSCTRSASGAANTSLTSDECANLTKSSSPSFVLAYSPKSEIPKFSIIYQTKATLKGNQDYYESCPIVALFG